jgi:hypothetical protein
MLIQDFGTIADWFDQHLKPAASEQAAAEQDKAAASTAN